MANPAPDPQALRRIIAGLVIVGLACILLGLSGLALNHNTSSGRVPFCIIALVVGVGALAEALAIAVQKNAA
jgi:choline-glycine betaine transporter